MRGADHRGCPSNLILATIQGSVLDHRGFARPSKECGL